MIYAPVGAGIELAIDECVIAQEKLWWTEGFCSPHELEKRIDDAETDSIQSGVGMRECRSYFIRLSQRV